MSEIGASTRRSAQEHASGSVVASIHNMSEEYLERVDEREAILARNYILAFNTR